MSTPFEGFRSTQTVSKNKSTTDIIVLYGSALFIGLSLIIIVGASNIITSAQYHGLSSAQFGNLFTPQIIFAILSSAYVPKLAQKLSLSRILFLGLLCGVCSMTFFSCTHFFIDQAQIVFIMLLTSTGFLGAAFGFSISAMNPIAYQLFPGRETSGVTGLHVFLGAGTAYSSILISQFHSIDYWWGSGFFIGSLLLIMAIIVYLKPIEIDDSAAFKHRKKGKIPIVVWLFVFLAFVYGCTEATLGNWALIYLESEQGFTSSAAALGYASFWIAAVVGRIFFAFIALKFNTNWLHWSVPFVVMLALFSAPFVASGFQAVSIIAISGLCLSFYFPNAVRIATDQYPQYAVFASGLMVGALQLGVGVSANIIGAIAKNVPLSDIFQMAAACALILGILGYWLSRPTETTSSSQQ